MLLRKINTLTRSGDIESQEIYTYNQGNKLLKHEYIKDGVTFIRERNQYDGNGNVTLKEEGVDEAGNINIQKQYSYYPDSKIRSMNQVQHNQDGRVIKNAYTYGYVCYKRYYLNRLLLDATWMTMAVSMNTQR